MAPRNSNTIRYYKAKLKQTVTESYKKLFYHLKEVDLVVESAYSKNIAIAPNNAMAALNLLTYSTQPKFKIALPITLKALIRSVLASTAHLKSGTIFNFFLRQIDDPPTSEPPCDPPVFTSLAPLQKGKTRNKIIDQRPTINAAHQYNSRKHLQYSFFCYLCDLSLIVCDEGFSNKLCRAARRET